MPAGLKLRSDGSPGVGASHDLGPRRPAHPSRGLVGLPTEVKRRGDAQELQRPSMHPDAVKVSHDDQSALRGAVDQGHL